MADLHELREQRRQDQRRTLAELDMYLDRWTQSKGLDAAGWRELQAEIEHRFERAWELGVGDIAMELVVMSCAQDAVPLVKHLQRVDELLSHSSAHV